MIFVSISNLNPPIILSCLRKAFCFQYSFLFVQANMFSKKLEGETARLMINRTETVENELLFLGMNGLELKKGQTNETK